MIKKSILSVFGGVVFAVLLSFAVPANAACLGLCADRIGNYYFDGCTITIDLIYDSTYPPQLGIVDVTCDYTEVAPAPSNIAE